ALALPTTVGQWLEVCPRQERCGSGSSGRRIFWESFDRERRPWFQGEFDLLSLKMVKGSFIGNECAEQQALFLEKLLQAALELGAFATPFDYDVNIKTYLEFPLQWGLGASSTLIYNLATWAAVDPVQLLFKSVGGSGYDVACAGADGPILYQKCHGAAATATAKWEQISWPRPFVQHLYFVYSGMKKSSAEAVSWYQKRSGDREQSLIKKITGLTRDIVNCVTLDAFDSLIREHEEIVSSFLQQQRVKIRLFNDYWGEVKSLGAWGGDFFMVTSARSFAETKEYFMSKGLDIFIPFNELVRQN
ncbi:MAG: hypothetical protein HQK53_13235, partial [Oligoflexia bacterium]|nr:hypothetical protein [Oligoflexia bacterium]